MAGAGSISPAEISGMSPVLVVGALLGQMKLTKSQCGQAVSLFGLSEAEKRLLNEVPVRSTPMLLTDPLIYRFRVYAAPPTRIGSKSCWRATSLARVQEFESLRWPLIQQTGRAH